MLHVFIGLFFIALGIWGIFDEWFYVIDFLKGSGSVFLILAGLLAIFAGTVGSLKKQDEDEITELFSDSQAEPSESDEEIDEQHPDEGGAEGSAPDSQDASTDDD